MRLEYIHSHVFVEGLDAKIPELLKQFPTMPPDEAERLIRSIAEADPTENKVYTPWLIKQVRKNNLRLPEDQNRAISALRLFDLNKRAATFPGPKDINAYKIFQDLEDVTGQLEGQELKSKRQAKREVKEKGARLAYDDGKYAAIEIVEPEAAVIYSKGSKWCTSNASTASHYLSSGPIHVIFKDGEKVAQMHAATAQFKNLQDRDYDWSTDAGMRKMISDIAKPTNGQSAMFLMRVSGVRNPAAEAMIAKDPNLSVGYAIDVIKGRWPEAEPAILDMAKKNPWSSQTAIKYAEKAIQGRWPEFEKILKAQNNAAITLDYVIRVIKDRVPSMEQAIITDPHQAVKYATTCIKGRWPEAEEAILTDHRAATQYAKSVLQQRWPRLEAHLLADPKSAAACVQYADDVIKDRWPEAEPKIAQSPQMLDYAEKHVKGPWPEVEGAIMRSNSENIFKYINQVLHGPWPRFENALLKALSKLKPSSTEWRDVARLTFKYSRDVKNGSWPEAEQLLAADPDFMELYRDNISLRRRSES